MRVSINYESFNRTLLNDFPTILSKLIPSRINLGNLNLLNF